LLIFRNVTVLYYQISEHFNLFLDHSLAGCDLYMHYFQQDELWRREKGAGGGKTNTPPSDLLLRNPLISISSNLHCLVVSECSHELMHPEVLLLYLA
jgi:hypothetical protein